MLQAMRMYFDGAMPSGHSVPENPSMHSPMAIAPLRTMTDTSHMLADSQGKGVIAPLHNLQVGWLVPFM